MSQRPALPDDAACPCGSGAAHAACCGAYLADHRPAPTAETLMRSRYTAYVLRDVDYLLRTWDPAHRPARLSLEDDRTQWLGLQILSTEAGGPADQKGRVRFIARFRLHGREQALAEHSRFRKQGDRWLYIDGDGDGDGEVGTAAPVRPAVARPTAGRNDPCPCGSGMKYKRCCGK
jgi:SEC-C motif-containing protein